MKKNKGFTLIELLAVIAILAVILIIAVPKVISTVENTKVGAFKANAQMLIKAIDLKTANDPTFNYTTLKASNIKEELGIDGSNYENISVTTQNGKIQVSIIGQGSWKNLQAEGTRESVLVTKVSTPPPGGGGGGAIAQPN